MPTINVSEKTKAELDGVKVHPRETYEEVIGRMLESHCMVNGVTRVRMEKQGLCEVLDAFDRKNRMSNPSLDETLNMDDGVYRT